MTKGVQGLNSCLWLAIEERIATAKIRFQWMLHPTSVSEHHGVLLTGPSAIGVIVAFRQKRTKQTVLHMKERHVLMQDHFDAFWRRSLHQIKQLA
jgi:hypothetical protein